MSDPRYPEMLKLRKKGLTLDRIGEHFHISKQRVSQIFRHNENPIRPERDDAELMALGDIHKIAARYQIHLSTAKKYAKRLGIPFPGGKTGRPLEWTRERVEVLHADYMTGLSQRKVGDKHGVEQTLISRLFRKYGLQTRYSHLSRTRKGQ